MAKEVKRIRIPRGLIKIIGKTEKIEVKKTTRRESVLLDASRSACKNFGFHSGDILKRMKAYVGIHNDVRMLVLGVQPKRKKLWLFYEEDTPNKIIRFDIEELYIFKKVGHQDIRRRRKNNGRIIPRSNHSQD